MKKVWPISVQFSVSYYMMGNVRIKIHYMDISDVVGGNNMG